MKEVVNKHGKTNAQFGKQGTKDSMRKLLLQQTLAQVAARKTQ